MTALGFGARLALQPGAMVAAGFDFAAGTLPPGATLTRASAGTRTNAAGTIVTEAADVARFDHDPPADLRGLLIEPARTNLLLRSAEFGAAAWGKTTQGSGAVPVVGGAVNDPAGGTGAASVTFAAGGTATADRSILQQAVATGLADNSGYVFSIWLRVASGTANITLTPVTNGTGSSAMAITAAVTTAWQRFAVSGATGSGATNVTARIYAQGTTQAAAVTVELWGAQLEAGGFASSYIAAGAAAATRVADVLTLGWGGRGFPDGPLTARYGFDDGSTQDVATSVSGGVAVVPMTLARRRIRSVARV